VCVLRVLLEQQDQQAITQLQGQLLVTSALRTTTRMVLEQLMDCVLLVPLDPRIVPETLELLPLPLAVMRVPQTTTSVETYVEHVKREAPDPLETTVSQQTPHVTHVMPITTLMATECVPHVLPEQRAQRETPEQSPQPLLATHAQPTTTPMVSEQLMDYALRALREQRAQRGITEWQPRPLLATHAQPTTTPMVSEQLTDYVLRAAPGQHAQRGITEWQPRPRPVTPAPRTTKPMALELQAEHVLHVRRDKQMQRETTERQLLPPPVTILLAQSTST